MNATPNPRRDALDRDEPGAPSGFLLDRDDDRTHEQIAPNVEVDDNPLAQGAGEEDDE